MPNRPGEFSYGTQLQALARQKNLCASCGEPVLCLGQAGQSGHKYGEGAEAHHIRHIKFGGTGEVGNCVVLCRSCHYAAHEGGNYTYGTVVGREEDYPHFKGC